MNHFGQFAPPPPNLSAGFQFALKWTPRAIMATLVGYYSLGIAYEKGIMAAIDKIAIRILRPSLGYIGMAVFMPTFQCYSSWGVRIVAAIGASIICDLIEKIACCVYSALYEEHPPLYSTPPRRSKPNRQPFT